MPIAQEEHEPLEGNNVKSVPQRSPFRYPGGKTWLVKQIREWLDAHGGDDVELIEPFAGGAIVSLTAVAEDLVGSAVLVERDEDVRDVWRAIVGNFCRTLAEQIRDFKFTSENLKKELSKKGGHIRDRAFRTILKNRVNRNGIIAPSGGMLKNGENGAGRKSRWYPETLSDRILEIVKYKDRLHVARCKTGLYYMRKRAYDENAIFFIDPPYPKVGRRLYKHSSVDPEKVFKRADEVTGDFLLTYRNTEEIRSLISDYDFEARQIYMQNGHNSEKTELLIGRDLSWTLGKNGRT